MRILTLFVLGLLLLLLFPKSIFAAASNYATSHSDAYTVEDSGLTHALMKIGLTNLTSKYYASTYTLKIGFTDITSVKAFDRKGPITPVLKKLEDGYQIELTFNDKVVGVGNTLNFTLSFDLNSIVHKNGSVTEISIPATANQETFSDFTVTIIPPASLGTPSIVRPHISHEDLTFSKKDLGRAGVQVIFGKSQKYSYQLTYHLKNSNVFPIRTEIALPPSTNYQESIIDTITPKPLNVLKDSDGNWLAQYDLGASEKKDIVVVGKAQVGITPRQSVLTSEEYALYTKELSYWQVTPEMKNIAEKLQTPREIYSYVIDTLSYDFDRRALTTKTRIGAKDILNEPTQAVCLEFTDLFIALSRAAGIPAREIDGFAYTNNKAERPLSLITDVLHAWPEYYDIGSRKWIMVDPTWGDTTNGMDYFSTLDLDHLAFVVKGKDSSYPVPAGGYKTTLDDLERDVTVDFIREINDPIQRMSFAPLFPVSALAGLQITGIIQVKNVGNGLSTPQHIILNSATLSPHIQRIDVPEIPPGGTILLPAKFDKTPFLTKRTHTFTIELAGKKIDQTLTVLPFFITTRLLIGGIIIAILTLGILIFARTAWGISFFRRKG